jgi:hypothetical protein
MATHSHFRWGSKVHWNIAILLVESHKLDPQFLDDGPRPKSGELSLNLHGTVLEGRSIGSDPKKELMIQRTKMQARVQGMVQLKDSICLKWVQIGS